MKKFQFSLSSIFALTVIAGALLAFADRLASEAFLQTIWLTTLLLSYGKFPQRGWSKILRVTAITGAVWSVGIFGTHLMYANVPGPRNLVWRAALVAASGIVAAFLAAWLLDGIIAIVRRWLTATVRVRLLSAVSLVAVTGSGWTIWNAARSGYWEPMVLSSADLPGLEADAVQRISYRHQTESSRIFSSDRSVMAKLQSAKILIFDPVTGEIAMSIEADKDAWFASITFLPKNGGLAAVQYQKSGDWKLLRWDSPDWTARDPVPLAELLEPSRPGKSYPILVDHILLLVYVDNRQAATRVEIKTVDFVSEDWIPKEFASAIIGPGDAPLWSDPLWMDWTVSPNGQWISVKSNFPQGTEWAFSRGAREPLRLPGHLLGYIRDGDQLVLGQETGRFVWQVFPRSPVVEPPFWNHLQRDRHHRVSVFDCPTNRVVKRSRWWRSSNGRLSFDESQVLLPTRHSVLIWETSQVAQVGRQP